MSNLRHSEAEPGDRRRSSPSLRDDTEDSPIADR